MKFFHLFWIGFLLLFFLSGCSQKKAPPAESVPTPGGTLHVAALAGVETLDPQKIFFLADLQIASSIYEGLVTLDAEQNPIPLLAESWQKLDGGRRLRFRLRPGVRFQDDPCFPGGTGRTVTAEDVQFSFQRLADPSVKSPNAYLFAGKIVGFDAYRAGKSKTIAGIRVLGPNEIEFRLTKPYFSFLTLLASTPAQIVPREAIATYGSTFGHHPVGTGPFRLARWKPLTEILLVKNDHYWQRDKIGHTLPRLDALQILLNSNPVEQISDFLKGTLDVLTVKEKQAQEFQKRSDFSRRFRVVRKISSTGARFFGFALDKQTPLARRVQLRRAIVQAFPGRRLAKSESNTASPATSLVPPFFLKVSPKSWPIFAPDVARRTVQRLLPESAPVVVCSNIKTPGVDLLCETLKKLNFRCKLDIHPVKYYAHIFRDRPDIFRVSFFPSYPDPEDYYALFSSRSLGNTNVTGYHSPEFDTLFEQALVEQNQAARQKRFLALENLLARDIPVIYLTRAAPEIVVAARKVQEIGTASSVLNFTRTWLEK